MDGNDEFLVIFKEKDKNKKNGCEVLTSFIMQPDSYDISLLANYENKCEFASFLWTGDILLKIMSRYMVFDNNGQFVYQVQFRDLENNDPVPPKGSKQLEASQSNKTPN